MTTPLSPVNLNFEPKNYPRYDSLDRTLFITVSIKKLLTVQQAMSGNRQIVGDAQFELVDKVEGILNKIHADGLLEGFMGRALTRFDDNIFDLSFTMRVVSVPLIKGWDGKKESLPDYLKEFAK